MTLKQVDLWDLSNKRVYVKIEKEIISSFFNYAISFADSKTILLKAIGKEGFGHLNDYLTGRSFVPLQFIKKILDLFPEKVKKEFEKELEANIQEIKCYGSLSKSIKNPKFPIKIVPEFFGLLANIVGDGSIEVGKDDKTPIISYTNKSSVLLDQFKWNVNYIFGQVKLSEKNNKGKVKQLRCPTIISVLINEVLGLPLPEGLEIIPLLISEQNTESKTAFLQSIFDDEGCVSIKNYQIIIEMANEAVIQTIKILLKELGIRSGKISPILNSNEQPRFRLAISGKNNLILFNEKIGFKNPDKNNKLKILINKYKIDYKRREELEKLIIKELKISPKISYAKLAKKLNKSKDWIRKNIKRMERNNLINSRILKNNTKIYSITKSGINEIS